MICVVCPIEVQFFVVVVIFIQLGAKVECATSKNDAFQILGLLTPGHQFKLVPDENYLALTRLPTDT